MLSTTQYLDISVGHGTVSRAVFKYFDLLSEGVFGQSSWNKDRYTLFYPLIPHPSSDYWNITSTKLGLYYDLMVLFRELIYLPWKKIQFS